MTKSLLIVALLMCSLSSIAQNTVLVPEFYSRTDKQVGDTVFKYLCYNAEHELISMDTVTDDPYFLQFVSLVQYYTHPAEVYKDEKGAKRPLPAEKIIHRYDRLGTNGWMMVNYRTNKSKYLKENPDQVVRTETVTTKSGAKVQYSYYKITQ